MPFSHVISVNLHLLHTPERGMVCSNQTWLEKTQPSACSFFVCYTHFEEETIHGCPNGSWFQVRCRFITDCSPLLYLCGGCTAMYVSAMLNLQLGWCRRLSAQERMRVGKAQLYWGLCVRWPHAIPSCTMCQQIKELKGGWWQRQEIIVTKLALHSSIFTFHFMYLTNISLKGH